MSDNAEDLHGTDGKDKEHFLEDHSQQNEVSNGEIVETPFEHQTITDEDAKRRVKLYRLSSDQWIDCGTGYCIGKKQPFPHFLVLNELNNNEILLKSTISGSIIYQRQQDTLIVWTNNDENDTNDYALSFQEINDCLDICKFLVDLQKNYETCANITLTSLIQSIDGEITETIVGPTPKLPIPTAENLNDILNLIKLNTQFKSKIINQILDNNAEWLKLLVGVFPSIHNQQGLPHLHVLNDILKNLIYLNEIEIYEVLISDEVLDDFLAILEFDTELPLNTKLNWRKILEKNFKLVELVKVSNQYIKTEIRNCFILKFLKDVVLARLLDDTNLNCLNNLIRNKECRILEFIQNDTNFLNELFHIYDSDNRTDKINGIKLIHQFIMISKEINFFDKYEFYEKIITNLNKLINFSMSNDEEVNSRILITEIILIIIDYDLFMFKNFDNNILILTLINILINEKNIGLKTQAFEAICILIDPKKIDNEILLESNVKPIYDKEYFKKFYGTFAMKLFKPLIDLDQNNNDKSHFILLENLCELLVIIIENHDKNFSRPFILENNVIKSLNTLLHTKFKFQLRLSSLRCLRSIIMLDDEIYTSSIIENDHLHNLMSLVEYSNDENNLISSTCLNFLNQIYVNIDASSFALLRSYLVQKYYKVLLENPIGKKIIDYSNDTTTHKRASEAAAQPPKKLQKIGGEEL